ncbi:MAG: lysophospholipid acyltransferase family protein [Elusimicrobiota bacterium]
MKRIIRKFFYSFIKNLSWLFFKLGWGLKVFGKENIPGQGAFILAANHRSYADPPIVGAALDREVNFLAKEELFHFKPFGIIISALNAHPLNRGGDIGAFKIAKRILDEGGVIIIFPEGRRIKTDNLAPAKAGIGLLATMAKVPILPVYIQNSGHMKKWKKLSVHIGQLIQYDSHRENQETADLVIEKINQLKMLQKA